VTKREQNVTNTVLASATIDTVCLKLQMTRLALIIAPSNTNQSLAILPPTLAVGVLVSGRFGARTLKRTQPDTLGFFTPAPFEG
jgi:hypothetical protein